MTAPCCTFAAIMQGQRIKDRSRPVAIWIMIGVGMLLIQVVLGGITRLTGSGLSITEWNVVTGTLPPLNQEQWLIEFEKYRQTPQYQLLNAHFSLADFKFIFFWEWFHRLWARLIAVAFLIPFVCIHYSKEDQPADDPAPCVAILVWRAARSNRLDYGDEWPNR
jgi:heme A synthase